MLTKKRAFWHYKILCELEHILDRKCSTEPESCPGLISIKLFGLEETAPLGNRTKNKVWCCMDCVELFSPFANLHMLAKRKFNKKEPQTRKWREKFHEALIYPCPCDLSYGFPDDLPTSLVIERVSDRINELHTIILE